jgi:hypothetical protein
MTHAQSGIIYRFALRGTEAQRAGTRESVASGAALTGSYLALKAAATLIAGFGLLENSPAVIIGAMLIAMLFGPIVGFALGLAGANMPLLGRSLGAGDRRRDRHGDPQPPDRQRDPLPNRTQHPRLVDEAGRWPPRRIYLCVDGLNRCYSRRGHRHGTGPSVDDVRHSVSSPVANPRRRSLPAVSGELRGHRGLAFWGATASLLDPARQVRVMLGEERFATPPQGSWLEQCWRRQRFRSHQPSLWEQWILKHEARRGGRPAAGDKTGQTQRQARPHSTPAPSACRG